MTNGDWLKHEASNYPVLVVQLSLQAEARQQIAQGEFALATETLLEAAENRDEFVSSNTSSILAVESSVGFNEHLQTLLENMAYVGQVSAAEKIVSDRLRTTINPYEADGLFYWIGTHQALDGNLMSALDHAKTSEEIARGIGSPWLTAQSQSLSSWIYRGLGREAERGQAIAEAQWNIEMAPQSELYFPDRCKLNATYAVQYLLRYYLGELLYGDREREMRHFCNEVLAPMPSLSSQAFLHHWVGQAELIHTKPIGKTGKFHNLTAATVNLKLAEDFFVAANQPVYAALVVLDQGYVADMRDSAERARVYVNAAIAQNNAIRSGGLGLEIEIVAAEVQQRILGTSVTNN